MNAQSHKVPLHRDLTILILTKDEELNLPHTLANVVGWAKDVMILDSGSSDDTCKIAEEMGAQVFVNPFETYAKQRNHALDHLPIETSWVMFLDADEYLLSELKAEIAGIPSDVEADGFILKRRFYFMGRWIKHGGYYPTRLLRLFRHGKGRVVRDINEQFEVEGTILELEGDFVDHNRKSLSEWFQKHLRYAEFEAEQLFFFEEAEKAGGRGLPKANFFGSQSERTQWIRQKIWNPLLPPLVRPFMYYTLRYFVWGGVRDGQAGAIYHFLQGLWLQFAIDSIYLHKKWRAEETSATSERDLVEDPALVDPFSAKPEGMRGKLKAKLGKLVTRLKS